MINAFFELEPAEKALRVMNRYRRDHPLYTIPHQEPEKLKRILENQDLPAGAQGVQNLYHKGILVDRVRSEGLERFKRFFSQVGPDVDLYSLSLVVAREYLRSEFAVIAYEDADLDLRLWQTPSPKDADAPRNYLVLYREPGQLRQLKQEMDAKRGDTLFLCRVMQGRIAEIGPMYVTHPTFCLDCMVRKLEAYHIRWSSPLSVPAGQLLEEEFLKSLIDHYSSYITLLSTVHERKMVLRDREIGFTSLITPRYSRCHCLIS
ncbi:hypothetical protein CM49_00773 [Paenibacillus sp. P1XP2]|nr:hypothetical protein CM49_00773 [Paenibacillus sp. P1XP2]